MTVLKYAPVLLALVLACTPLRAADAEQELLALLNRERATRGLQSLSLHSALSGVAARHARLMAKMEDAFHVSPAGTRPGERILSVPGLLVLSLAENVAKNATLPAAHDSLMASPGHRKNILNPLFTHVGLAVIRSKGSVYVVENFVQLPENTDIAGLKAAFIAGLSRRGIAADPHDLLEKLARRQCRQFMAAGEAPPLGNRPELAALPARNFRQLAISAANMAEIVAVATDDLAKARLFGAYFSYQRLPRAMAQLYGLVIWAE